MAKSRQHKKEPRGHEISLDEDELYGGTKTLREVRQIVYFSMDQEWYGIDIAYVREVVSTTPITSLPFVPEHILGVMNLRGDIISVTNLRPIFGLAGNISPESHRLVVIEDRGLATALSVDRDVEAIEVELDQIDTSFSSWGTEKEKLLEAQIRWNGRLIGLLDAKKVLRRTSAHSDK